MRTCSVSGCSGAHRAHGLCGMHYIRKRRGTPLDAAKGARPKKACLIGNCKGTHYGHGMCRMHYYRKRNGFPLDLPKQNVSRLGKGRYACSNGYITVGVPDRTPGSMVSKNRHRMLEHRLVMQNWLGRPLLHSETVHHKDGDRANNALKNLELRSGNHGPGVRVSDETIRCVDYLMQYVGLELHQRAALAEIRDMALSGKSGPFVEQRPAPKKNARKRNENDKQDVA